MYILLNETGNITTCIPHTDGPIRQGNSFDLNICFPKDDRYLNLSPFAEFSVGGQFVIAGDPDYDHWGLPSFVFQKQDVNEAVFDFVPGQAYYRYRIHVSRDSGVTAVSGQVPMIVSVILNEVQREGRATLNILKTYGSSDVIGVDSLNLDTLMSLIKKSTNLYQYDSEPMNNATLENVWMYSWKTIGFVRGFVTLNGELENMPDFEGAPGYAAVAKFEPSADVTVPAVITGHSSDNDDVEFRLVGDGNPGDMSGTAYLLLNKHSDVSVGERLSFVGAFMATQNTFYFNTDGDQPASSIEIKDILVGHVTTLDNDAEADVKVRLVPLGDEVIGQYNLYLDFFLPKGKDGEDGQNGTPAGFGNVIAECHTTVVSDASQAEVLVSPTWDASTPNTAKGLKFDFYFKLPPQVNVQTQGMFGFLVDQNGILQLSYSGATAPNIALVNGELIYTY